jgi:hypothetical protein
VGTILFFLKELLWSILGIWNKIVLKGVSVLSNFEKNQIQRTVDFWYFKKIRIKESAGSGYFGKINFLKRIRTQELIAGSRF